MLKVLPITVHPLTGGGQKVNGSSKIVGNVGAFESLEKIGWPSGDSLQPLEHVHFREEVVGPQNFHLCNKAFKLGLVLFSCQV